MPSPDELSLVLGADGFVGRNLCRYFVAHGWPVISVGRKAGDLSDPAVVNRIFAEAPKVSRILHLVTRQRTGQVQYDIQGELLAINARIHLNVLEAWRQYQPGAKLISTGSSCAFPEWDKPLPEEAFQSGHVHPSVKGYALAKQMLAVGSAAYAHQYGLRYLHCILATLYGPCDHREPDRSHFMGAMIDRAVREKATGATRFTVWGDPATVRELLYVDDQIEAILAADAKFENTLLNCAANRPITIHEAAAAIRDVLEWDAEIHYPLDSFRGAGFKMLDSSRFLAETGWEPKTDLRSGIRMVLNQVASGAE